jgi:hypothetical protein
MRKSSYERGNKTGPQPFFEKSYPSTGGQGMGYAESNLKSSYATSQ